MLPTNSSVYRINVGSPSNFSVILPPSAVLLSPYLISACQQIMPDCFFTVSAAASDSLTYYLLLARRIAAFLTRFQRGMFGWLPCSSLLFCSFLCGFVHYLINGYLSILLLENVQIAVLDLCSVIMEYIPLARASPAEMATRTLQVRVCSVCSKRFLPNWEYIKRSQRADQESSDA